MYYFITGGWPLLLGNYQQEKSIKLQTAVGQVQIGHQEEFLHWKVAQALARMAHGGGGGVSVPGGVQGVTGYGTQYSSLGDTVGISHRLDFISEVFSNLSDSMIL